MDRKIRVGAVSYLNTKPMITGLEQMEEIQLHIDYPAKIAEQLLAGSIDIGLVPVAILSQLDNYYLIGDYGIACDGAVASVSLFSDVPIEQIQTIFLDYQSRTSVELLKILLQEYWQKEVYFIDADPGYEKKITGTTAGLIIGDRALTQKNNYVYDLGHIWKLHTGLPFVFATWVSNKKHDAAFVKNFNDQVKNNIGQYFLNMDTHLADEVSKKYLRENIQYRLTKNHHAAIRLFLEKILNKIPL